MKVSDYFPKLVNLLGKTPKRFILKKKNFRYLHYIKIILLSCFYMIIRTIANYLVWQISSESILYLKNDGESLPLKHKSGASEQHSMQHLCTDIVSS